jgi:hypothetical protein
MSSLPRVEASPDFAGRGRKKDIEDGSLSIEIISN